MVASFACETNDFANTSYSEVFGETWILQPQKGAVTFIGSADYSYWSQDDQLERAMYDHLFIESSLTRQPSLQHCITDLKEFRLTYPVSSKYYWETYNILGDPSTRIWLGPRATDFRMSSQSSEISVCISQPRSITDINISQY